MDADIAAQELNDFESLKSLAPNVRLVCFNGRKAADAMDSVTRLKYQTILLPSSSEQTGRTTLPD